MGRFFVLFFVLFFVELLSVLSVTDTLALCKRQ